MTEAALRARGLSMAFGSHLVLDRIDLDVADGEFLSIVGPSGCGKTTLLRLLAGLVQPTGGEILAAGKPILGPSRERAIVFQDYSRSLLPWRSVWSNVALAFESQGIARAERRERAGALLERMGLSAVGEYFPGQLSGGMQQRVQIARCLAQQPRIMLMDEPFGALDALTRQTLQDEIARLAAERRVTVVFITHDLEEAIYLGDRVVALAPNPGRVAETIAVGLARPRHQLTTREDPGFLAHRHRLFNLLVEH
ncbi:MAG TPA: ABC transporter ATP-binding protein [Stellaceae bacterium]|jgi:NitT/TauT family transport system ATP-binding protein|nr:ABC transporter ATP-binding protein [Stellaceae bacterium]